MKPRPRSAILVGGAVGLYLFLLMGNSLALGGDEGIFLEGARRLLRGDALYTRQFTLTGPGTFYVLAGLFRVFGESLRVARLLPVLDVAVLSGCVWWVARRLGARIGAGIAVAGFVFFQFYSAYSLGVNHRWDSAAAATLGLVLAVEALETAWLAWLAGAALALAGWFTPSVLIAGLPAVLVLVKRRELLLKFLVGGALLSLVPGAVLWQQGSLGAMVESMTGFAGAYATANQCAYGATPGGYGWLFEGEGAERIGLWMVGSVMLLPAALPLLAGLGGLFLQKKNMWQGRAWVYVGGAVLLALSAYPRWDSGHLGMVGALGAAVFAAALSEAPAWLGRLVGLGTTLVAGCYAALVWVELPKQQSVESAFGRVRVGGADAKLLQVLEQRPGRGHTLFVHPYFPDLYVYTGSLNPTRYSYLQPGMMGPEDERDVLDSLEKAPPEWVLMYHLPEAQVLQTWPGSDRGRMQFRGVEGWVAAHCTEEGLYLHPKAKLRLWRCAP